MKVITILVALIAIGYAAISLAICSPLVIISAIGAVQALVLILLNTSSLWAWLTLFGIGVMAVFLLLLLQYLSSKWLLYILFTIMGFLVLLNHSRLWSWVKNVTVEDVVAAVLVLLNRSSSWSWLNAIPALLTIFTIGFTMPWGPNNEWPMYILFPITLGTTTAVTTFFAGIMSATLLIFEEILAVILFFRDTLVQLSWTKIIPSKMTNHA